MKISVADHTMMTKAFHKLMRQIKEVNRANGWDPTEEDLNDKWFIPGKLALIHSEVSEALEAHRNVNKENFREELADIMIRVLDLYNNLSLFNPETDILAKLDKNMKRGHKHGDKLI